MAVVQKFSPFVYISVGGITAVVLVWMMAGWDRPAQDYTRVEDAAYLWQAVYERQALAGLFVPPPEFRDIDVPWTNHVVTPYRYATLAAAVQAMTNSISANSVVTNRVWVAPVITGETPVAIELEADLKGLGRITSIPPMQWYPYPGPTTNLLQFASNVFSRLQYAIHPGVFISTNLYYESTYSGQMGFSYDYETEYATAISNAVISSGITTSEWSTAWSARWNQLHGLMPHHAAFVDWSLGGWPTEPIQFPLLPTFVPRFIAAGNPDCIVTQAWAVVEDSIHIDCSYTNQVWVDEVITWAQGLLNEWEVESDSSQEIYAFYISGYEPLYEFRRARLVTLTPTFESDPSYPYWIGPASLTPPSMPSSPAPIYGGDDPYYLESITVQFGTVIHAVIVRGNFHTYPLRGFPWAEGSYYDPTE